MSFTKFASFQDAQVLDIKGSSRKEWTANLATLSTFNDYRTGDGYLYVRIRAISSRVNRNHDGWPSIELAGGKDIFEKHARQSSTGFTVEASEGDSQYGFATFLGKPNFVDHNNSDPKRARGVVVDARLRVLPKEASHDKYYSSGEADPEHLPPTEVELLLEIDAKSFPKYAKAIRSGDLDGFSMGCDVEKSKCSHCGHEASSPDEYCSHILMKGAQHDFKTADGHRVSRKSYENCYGIKFFEISGVFDPADETALAREIRAGVIKEAENPLPQSFHTTAPDDVDTLRQEHTCPQCGEVMDHETCDVCGYVEPPEGMGNPDLGKAQELEQQMKQNDEAIIKPPGGSPEDIGNQGMPQGPEMAGGPMHPQQQGQGGSFMQTRNRGPTASVMSEMRWAPKIDSRLAARINQFEKPLQATTKPASNEPVEQTVIKNPTKPVTATMRTAQELIQAAKGDTMSTKTADGPTPPGDTSADTRTDVTGVGGVMDASNDAASKADAQVDVTSIGTTGITDVGAEKTESLPTASEGSDDSGFNTDKTTEDSGPTKTFGDSDGTEKGFTDEVTSDSLEGNQNKGSSTHVGYDAKPFYDQPGLSGGSANKGTQPSDSVATPGYERVDVLSPATTPDAMTSGPTKTWTGTGGNSIYKQQDPVTNESMALGGGGEGTGSANWTSHIVAAIKLADLEVELDLLPKDEKYNRLALLQEIDKAEVEAQLNTLSRVKTAGLAKLAQARTAGVTKMPGQFGRRTAAPSPDWRAPGRSFDRVTDSEHLASMEELPEDVMDSSLFSR